jgi:hypothetical protein
MASQKSVPGTVAKKTRVRITPSLKKASPAERDRSPSADLQDIHARISARAYALYKERGSRQGYDLQDWLGRRTGDSDPATPCVSHCMSVKPQVSDGQIHP